MVNTAEVHVSTCQKIAQTGVDGSAPVRGSQSVSAQPLQSNVKCVPRLSALHEKTGWIETMGIV